MPHFPRARPAVVLVAALASMTLLAACGGEEEPDAPAATVPERSTTSTTEAAEPADDLAIPLLIDQAYLDRVMDRADELLRDAFAAAHEAGEARTAFEEALTELYVDREAQELVGQVAEVGLDRFADPPGLPTTTVETVLTATPECVFFAAQRDLVPLSVEPYPQRQPYWLHLVPEPADPALPWRIAEDVFFADGSVPGNPCA